LYATVGHSAAVHGVSCCAVVIILETWSYEEVCSVIHFSWVKHISPHQNLLPIDICVWW